MPERHQCVSPAPARATRPIAYIAVHHAQRSFGPETRPRHPADPREHPLRPHPGVGRQARRQPSGRSPIPSCAGTREAMFPPDGRPDGPVWLFGYGSLIWNPAFEFAEKRPATVHGLHRRFCLRTFLGRGSKDRPGLVLALDRGGCCRGVAFRIAAERVESELDIVWRREMISDAYRPRWLTAVHPRGTGPGDRVRHQPRARALYRGAVRAGGRRDHRPCRRLPRAVLRLPVQHRRAPGRARHAGCRAVAGWRTGSRRSGRPG